MGNCLALPCLASHAQRRARALCGILLALGAGGVTELRSGIGLSGLLKADGGSLLFRDADVSMTQGRIELAAGVRGVRDRARVPRAPAAPACRPP